MFSDFDNLMFDLYGTLIDIKTDERAAITWKNWCRWLDARRIKHPVYYRFREDFFRLDREYRAAALREGVFEVPEIEILEVYDRLFKAYGNKGLSMEFLKKASYAFRVCSREYYRLFPGVGEFLLKRKAEGKKLYLLSNAQSSYTMPEIKALGLDQLLDQIMISSDERCMKPDAAFYNKLIRKYDLDKSRTLMMGDSYENDVKGAVNAGISAIHLVAENHPSHFYTDHL